MINEYDEYAAFTSPTTLQKECIRLFYEKQYKSCEILARMDLARCESQGREKCAIVVWQLCISATSIRTRSSLYQ
jgi:hypothetical protein